MSEQRAKNNNIQDSKLIQLLKVLSPLELKRFKKFLESPFHNSNNLLVQLYGLLKKYHPTYNNPQLTKEKLFAKLFDKKPYQPKRMNDLMYDLRRLVEDFLIVSDTLGEKQERQTKLVKLLANRNHPSFDEEAQKLMVAIQGKTTYLTGKDYLKLHLINDQLWFHINTPKNNIIATPFKEAHENLDLYYILTKLQYFAEQEGRKKIFKESEHLTFFAEILNFVADKRKEKPLLFLFEQIIELTKGTLSKEKYFELKEKIILHGPKIEVELRRDLLMHLSNYCVQQNNRGHNEFIKEALNIYKIMIANNLLIVDGKIADYLFLNISNFANKCGEYEWAETFIGKYKIHLDHKIKEEVLNVAKVYTHFFQKNYNGALALINLQKINKNYHYYYSVRVQLMKVLYNDWTKLGVNNIKTLLDQSIALEQSVKRNSSFSDEKIKAYLNFVRYFRALVKLRRLPERSLTKIRQLEKDLMEEKLLTFKDWLLEQIKEMKSR